MYIMISSQIIVKYNIVLFFLNEKNLNFTQVIVDLNWDFSYYYQYNRLIFVFVIILIQVMSLNMRHMTEIGLILMTCHFTMGREHLIMIM